MNRRTPVFLLLSVTLLFRETWTDEKVCRAEDAARPPNIVLFLVDDMGAMDTSVPF